METLFPHRRLRDAQPFLPCKPWVLANFQEASKARRVPIKPQAWHRTNGWRATLRRGPNIRVGEGGGRLESGVPENGEVLSHHPPPSPSPKFGPRRSVALQHLYDAQAVGLIERLRKARRSLQNWPNSRAKLCFAWRGCLRVAGRRSSAVRLLRRLVARSSAC